MKFASLASGSSGNAFVLKNKNKIFLFDAGISCKQTFDRLEQLNINPKKIDSIFISHEHTDHIKGIDILAKKTNAEIYMTKKTFLNANIKTEKERISFFKSNDTIKKQNLEINLFDKNHDSVDPVSFIIQGNRNLSILTDIGVPCQNVIESVKESDSIILESNHDLNMLQKGKYPYVLQKRISSDKGHLSNNQAALLILEHAKQNLNNLLLGHLSLNNNSKDLVNSTMKNTLKYRKLFKPNLSIATRESPSYLFNV